MLFLCYCKYNPFHSVNCASYFLFKVEILNYQVASPQDCFVKTQVVGFDNNSITSSLSKTLVKINTTFNYFLFKFKAPPCVVHCGPTFVNTSDK